MKRFALSLCCVIALAFGNAHLAYAQDDDVLIQNDKNITTTDCALIKQLSSTLHTPSSGIHHQPSAGVEHNSSGQAIKMPEPFTIPLTIDVFENMGLDLPEGIGGEGHIGNIDIYMDGRILFNGENISDKMHTLCE